jgi:hypothetical protein
VENSKSEFPTLSSALGNPAKSAGFPHFHSDDGGYAAPQPTRMMIAMGNIFKLQDDQPKVTFSNCLTG